MHPRAGAEVVIQMQRLAFPTLALLSLAVTLGPACQCGSASTRSRAPILEVVPPEAVFPPLALGKNSIVTLQVHNSGNDTLHLTADPLLTESDTDGSQEFSLPSILAKDCEGAARTGERKTLEPGECAVIAVRYEPTDLTGNGGNILFASDDPEHSQLNVPVRLGDPAALQICVLNADGTQGACDAADGTPPTLDFGMVAQGGSTVRKVRLINAGTVKIESLVISSTKGPQHGEYTDDTSVVPAFIDVGASAELPIRYTPTGGGQRSAWVEIASNDSKRDLIKVPLSGSGEGPGLCAIPSPVDFGEVNMGTQKDLTLTLKSCGTVPVQLQELRWDPFTSTAYSNTTPFPAPQTLAPNATVTVALRFQPQEAGPLTGALLIPNDGQPGQYVELLANALDAPICRLRASVTSLDFGQVVVNQTATRQVSVANAGKADCTLTKASITQGSAYYSVQNAPTAAVTLRPNDVYQVTVNYKAGIGTTAQTGKLSVESDDPVTPVQDVALTAQPVATAECKLDILPSGSGGIGGFGGRALNFGTVIVGAKKTLPITLRNVGSANCTFSHIKLAALFSIGPTCSGTNDCGSYHIVPPTAVSSVAPGQSTQVNVTFEPQSISQTGGSFMPTVYALIDTNAAQVNTQGTPECMNAGFPPNSSLSCVGVGLSGEGDISALSVLPSDLDFGLVTLGCSAREENVTLYNTGRTATINITSLALDPTNAPFQIIAPPTPFGIPAAQSVKIKVKYRPTLAQRESAVLRIGTDAQTAASGFITVGLSGTGTTDKHQTDTFHQATQPLVDLLFVVDNSGSMQDYQSELSAQGPKFAQVALSKNVDYHFGVTTTDADVDGDEKTDSYSSYSNTPYFVGGLFGRPEIVTNATPSAGDALAKNIKVGTCCSDGRESGLESAWKVLTPNANQTVPPQGSKGFLRDEARLVMLNVTDELDQSSSTAAFYTDFFQQLKGRYNAGLVSWNTISGDEKNGCQTNGISADANDLGWAVAHNTSGRAYSLCSADWATIANDLSLDAFNGRNQFPLTRVADPATLSVSLNGQAQTNPSQYSYDSPSNSILFVTAPPPGATIVADYDALCF